MDYEYKNYHDNRAFQFHNNNTLTKGKTSKTATTKIYGLPINDANALDVVIVQGKSGSGNYASGKLLESLPNHNGKDICKRSEANVKEKASSVCRRHQRRHKHNATQTPLMATGWQQLSDDGSCSGVGIGGVACPSCLSICTMSSCVKHAHCFHHGEQHLGAGTGAGAGLAEVTCHCHITHHCHQYSPSGQSSRKGKHQSQRQCRPHRGAEQCERAHHHHQHQHRRHHQNRQHQNQQQQQKRHHHHQESCQCSQSQYTARQLPTEGESFKSSIDSSAEHPLRQSQCQEIAIEIDAATMTEDNGSTATSNFAYKMAKGQKENQRINHDCKKLAPYSCRRESINSNTTIETDELSRDDDGNVDNDDDEDDDEPREHNEVEKLTAGRSRTRIENNCSAITRTIGSDLDDGSCLEQDANGVAYCPYGVPLSKDVHNECVRIKRKRFLPNEGDYCSSCSSCSCARCDDNTSSCSSLENDDLDNYNASTADDARPPHEFTVSAECHRCNVPRQSSSASTMDEADDERDDQDRADRRILVSARSVSSTHTSRRSSESFCSCNSNSCHYCSCSCEECDTTGRMRTAREGFSNATEAPLDFDEQHSSTLTPLTNPSSIVSTPLADDAAADLTIRSGASNVFAADDASSLSQSAEYFSIASSNPQSRGTPTITPVHKPSASISTAAKSYTCDKSENTTPPTKQCKHYSKHHRHKHPDTKQDGYL